VALVVDPPEIVLTPEDPIPVGTQPGKQRAVEYLAELKWLPGSQWEFQPDPPGQILFVRRSSPGSAPVPNSLEVGYTGLSDTITLHTGQTRPLRLTLNVPESAAVGDYQGAVDLKDLRSPKPRVAGQLRMQLALNRLQVHFPVDIPGQTPELTESLSIPQFFGIALRREFRVSTTVQGHDGKPVRLEPGKLGIFPEGDVMRTDEAAGGVRKIPAPCLNKKQQEATDSFVVIQADFEARHNADPDRPYRMVVLLRYDELDLETRLDLNLRFVDPRQLFRSPATAP
jgi:hypothetical protein